MSFHTVPQPRFPCSHPPSTKGYVSIRLEHHELSFPQRMNQGRTSKGKDSNEINPTNRKRLD